MSTTSALSATSDQKQLRESDLVSEKMTSSVNQCKQLIQKMGRNLVRFVQQNRNVTILLTYVIVFSCFCVKNALCEVEPQPDKSFEDDDDDDGSMKTLVSSPQPSHQVLPKPNRIIAIQKFVSILCSMHKTIRMLTIQ